MRTAPQRHRSPIGRSLLSRVLARVLVAELAVVAGGALVCAAAAAEQRGAIAAAAAAGALALAAATWLALRSALRREALGHLEAIAEAAARLRRGELAARAEAPGAPDEIARVLREVSALAEQMQAAAPAAGALPRSVSHQLRSPLNAIINYTKLIGRERYGPLTPQQRELQGRVLASADRLIAEIDGLFEPARPAEPEAERAPAAEPEPAAQGGEPPPPRGALLELEELARLGDFDAIGALIGRIEAEAPRLAARLRAYADVYDDRAIRRAAAEALARRAEAEGGQDEAR